MQSILKDTPSTLYRTFSFDGTAADLDAEPAVTITDPYGTAVDTGTASATATTGEYSYLWEPDTVGDYTVAWVGAKAAADVTHRETLRVKGAHLITETEIRAWHGNDLSNTTRFPDELLARLRDRIEAEFSQILGVNVVPYHKRFLVPGTGTNYLTLPVREIREVLRVRVNGTTVDPADLEVAPPEFGEAVLYRPVIWNGPTYGSAMWNVDVAVECGWLEAPEAIRQAALTTLRYLIDSNQSDRVIRTSDDLQTVVYATPGRIGQWYGLPMVDATLARHRHRSLV